MSHYKGKLPALSLAALLAISPGFGATGAFARGSDNNLLSMAKKLFTETVAAPKDGLTTPENVKLDATGNFYAKLGWQPVEGTLVYEIYRSQAEDAGYEKVGATPDTVYFDTNLKKDTKYFYKVKATALLGNSDLSQAIPAKTTNADLLMDFGTGAILMVNEMEELTETPGMQFDPAEGIGLYWDVSEPRRLEQGEEPPTYSVYRAQYPDMEEKAIGEATTEVVEGMLMGPSYIDKDVQPGKTYFYRFEEVGGDRSVARYVLIPGEAEDTPTSTPAPEETPEPTNTPGGETPTPSESQTPEPVETPQPTPDGSDAPDESPGASPSVSPEDGMAVPELKGVGEAEYQDALSIEWKAVDDAIAYNVYRSNSEDGIYEMVGSTYELNYLDWQQLRPQTTYWYRVSAVYSGDESAMSEAASGSTGSEETEKSQHLEALPGSNGGVDLLWNREDIAGNEAVKVYRSEFPDAMTPTEIGKVEGAEAIFTDEQIQPGRKYYYFMKSEFAVVRNIPERKTNIAYIETPSLAAPKLVAEVSDARVLLKWGAVEGADAYVIYRRVLVDDETAFEEIGRTADTEYTDTGIQPDSDYEYRLVASDSTTKESSWPASIQVKLSGSVLPTATPQPTISAEPSATPQPTPEPTGTPVPTATVVPSASPTVTPEPTQTPIPTSTEQPTSTPAPTALPTAEVTPTPAPTVEPQPSPTDGPAETTEPTAQPTSKPETPAPTSGQGDGAIGLPSRPGSVKAAAKGPDSVLLTWKKAERATGYVIYRADAAGGEYIRLDTIGDAQTYIDTTAPANGEVWYKVAALNDAGEGSPCAPCAVKLYSSIKATIQGPRVWGMDAYKIKWTPVSGSERYTVYRSRDGVEYTQVYMTSGLLFTDTLVVPDKTYWYKVVSDNGVEAIVSTDALDMEQ